MENTENKETALAIQLTPFEATKENLVALASDYKNMVVTRENLKEANEARLVLYRKRIEIQNVAKANRKTIKDFLKSNNDAIETELIETIEPTELALEAKIKAIKDAIAEEERIEAARISKHKQRLEVFRSKLIEVTNSNDIDWLKTWFEEDEETINLEEFQEELEQLLVTIKETAKNRLELLEFQAKKKAEEEAEEKEAQKVFDMSEPTEPKVNIEVAETAKLSPLKTVPIGAGSEYFKENNQLTDKEMLKDMSIFLEGFCVPEFKSKEALQHGTFVRSMLIKLSEQTLKVAEKL